uniref:(E2-independent) E3 ubiquitin-conjugating enzyme FATS n=1 Tax=Geotrypetes seraphini TaxID=260995 RepID=A0A6P8Q9W0_GEOSA|nr:(E2-independent) E3 ubiquitin-conjugating enzyme FATS [Geotrypetes seraphini]
MNGAINVERTLGTLQEEHGLEKEENTNKVILGSYNAKLISSIVISQMNDESKSEENGPALLMQPVITQPNAYCIKQSWTNHNLINSNKAFIIRPSKLGTETSLANLHNREEKPYHKQRKGFTSITVTARQIQPSPNQTVCGASGDPQCLKYSNRDHPQNIITPSGSAELIHQHFALHCHGPYQNGSPAKAQHPNLHAGQQNLLCNPGYLSSVNHRKKVQGSFSSHVDLKLSYQSPSIIYYIDKSLFVSFDQSQIATQTIYRSVLFVNIHCNSSKPTPDGVNDLANREPIVELQKRASPKEESLLTAKNRDYIKNQINLRRQCQRRIKCDCIFPVDNMSIGDHPTEAYFLMAKDKKGDDNSNIHSCTQHQHFLKDSDGHVNAGESIRCYSFQETKQCKESDEEETACIVPADSLNIIPAEKVTGTQSKGSRKSGKIPSRPLSLREALEFFRPDFISRSQKRIEKLIMMAQLRKAQVNKIPHKKKRRFPFAKPSSTPTKKLYTVPHPLSDNLFRPKERIISKKEMQLRSKRIYNNLPEVKRKKEEEKKRAISQRNRLRAELFKKKLLDQILQRNAD